MTSQPPPGWPEALTRLRWFRGTYLDQMVTFEAILDARIFEYLEVPEDLRMLFYGAVTTRMGLRAKKEMICDFIDHFDQSGEWLDLKAGIRDSVDFRNRCAHWHIEPIPASDGSWEANFVRWRRGEIQRMPITEEEFTRRTEQISALVSELLRFASSVATSKETQRMQEASTSDENGNEEGTEERSQT